MKKLIVAATLVVAGALALTGCGPSVVAAPAPVPTVTVTAEPAPAPAPTKDSTASPETDAEQSYLTALHSEDYFVAVNDDELLLDTGYAVCKAFDRGASVEEIAVSASGSGIPGYEAGFLIGAAVTFFCPEHLPILNEFVNETN